MSKKARRIDKKNKPETIEKTFSEKTERLFKKILRTMTGIVIVCFIFIIILPLFNTAFLDLVTRILFYIGVLNLLVFTFLELIQDRIKQTLQKFTDLA